MERPTWANYAIGDASERPHLWRGCVFAAAPCLGPTGNKLFDLARGRKTLDLYGITPDLVWVTHGGAPAISLNAGAENDNQFQNATWDYSLGDATICAWVYSRDSRAYRVLLDNRDSNSFRLLLGGSNTLIGGGLYTTDYPYGSFGTISTNTWTHVAIRRLGDVNRTWINGSNATSSDYTSVSTATAGSSTFVLGFNISGGSEWNGMLDDIRIYDRALSEAEIRELAEYRGVAYQPKRDRSFFVIGLDQADDPSSASSASSPSSASSLSSASSASSNSSSSPSSASSNSSSSSKSTSSSSSPSSPSSASSASSASSPSSVSSNSSSSASSSSSSISTSSSSTVGTGEYQQASATSSVKTSSVFSIPADCYFVEITADTQEVRYTMDNSTAPTQSSGMRFRVGGRSKIFSVEDFRRIKFVRGAGSDGVLNVHFLTDL